MLKLPVILGLKFSNFLANYIFSCILNIENTKMIRIDKLYFWHQLAFSCVRINYDHNQN